MSLESIRVINQETKKRGDVEPEMGKHWIVRLKDITPKRTFGKRKGQKTGVCPKQAKTKTGSSGEPVLRDTLDVAVNEGG
jgi:hypothetical protein